ncbi:proline-rich protein [Hysterangium stoloniferum]|nr:proline-rich protein [Hysterangium stoloniferum]
MIFSSSVFYAVASIVALTPQAAPLEKRIAQVISDSTTQWVQACTAAGGGEQCNPISVTAFSTLLAAAGDCDQQNAADSMIDLAKTLNNNPKMIALAQVFAQQPRNSPNSLSVNYCQQQPKNVELNGLFQCQFQSVNPQIFTGNVKVGAKGTIPLGLNAPLNPSGSCKAHPQGPIADGTQLTAITQDPGVKNSIKPGPVAGTPTVTDVEACPTMPASGAVPAGPAPSAGGFQVQNGKDAQALNAKFASLTASSPCNEGDEACVNNGFAQCVGGKFAITQCAGGTQCFGLPLVNKPGTSIACTTEADARSRIQASGAIGGITGA